MSPSGLTRRRSVLGVTDSTVSDPRRQLGALGEQLATDHLQARGLEILERNFRTRYGELDLVAADARHLIFCEVKTRIVRGNPGPLGPFAAIGGRKRRQVRLMARLWLAAQAGRRPHPPELRFDAVGVSLDPSGRLVAIEHLEGAF
jgi:putative endonuclease